MEITIRVQFTFVPGSNNFFCNKCIYATKYNNNKINNHFFIIIIENLATHHPKLLPEKKKLLDLREFFYREDKNNQLSKNVVFLSKSIHYCEMELLYFLVSEKSAPKFHTLMQIVWLFRFTTYFCVNNLKERK